MLQLIPNKSLFPEALTNAGAAAWLTYRRVALGVMVLTVIGGLVWALRPAQVLVDMATVHVGPVRVTVDEEAKTRIRNVYVVSAPIGGKVLRTPLEAGDNVIKDETIVAVIEPEAPQLLDLRTFREAEAQVAAARAAVNLAEADLNRTQSELSFAESDLTRAQALARSTVISARALEKSKLDAAMAQAAVVRAQANLDVRKRELESTQARLIGPMDDANALKKHANACCVEIKAPVSGRVLRRIHESEKVATPGTPLIEIGNPQDLEIVVELLSTDAVKIREGAPVTVEAWGGGTILPAKVRRIEPSGFTKNSALGIEEQRVRVILDFVGPVDARPSLGHDFRVYVRIDSWNAENTMRVPISALFRKDGRWAAYTVEEGRAKLVQLELGQRNAEFAVVSAGLPEGSRVILHPSDRVGVGVRIKERAKP